LKISLRGSDQECQGVAVRQFIEIELKFRPFGPRIRLKGGKMKAQGNALGNASNRYVSP
jgi:hypothetical protein